MTGQAGQIAVKSYISGFMSTSRDDLHFYGPASVDDLQWSPCLSLSMKEPKNEEMCGSKSGYKRLSGIPAVDGGRCKLPPSPGESDRQQVNS